MMSDWQPLFSVGDDLRFVIQSDQYVHTDGTHCQFVVIVTTRAGESHALRVENMDGVAELVEQFQPREIRAEGADAGWILAALDMLSDGATLH